MRARRLMGGLMMALALVACGKEAARADDGQPAAATMEQLETPIPSTFHGRWAVLGACEHLPSTFIISANAVLTPGENGDISNRVTRVSETAIELLAPPDPDYPDSDQRFGLSLQEGMDMLTLSGPEMSSLRVERCDETDASATPADPAAGNALEGLPEPFLGEWDSANSGESCTGFSGDGFTIEARRIVYEHGVTSLSNFRRINSRTYKVTGQYTSASGETRPAMDSQFSLDEKGRMLTESFEDYDPFHYTKC